MGHSDLKNTAHLKNDTTLFPALLESIYNIVTFTWTN